MPPRGHAPHLRRRRREAARRVDEGGRRRPRRRRRRDVAAACVARRARAPSPARGRRCGSSPIPGRAASAPARSTSMLASPLWADHWTAYWDDVWMGARHARARRRPRGVPRVAARRARAKTKPWNEIVTQLLTATGVNSEGGRSRDAYANDGKAAAPRRRQRRGQLDAALPADTPQDMAGAASRTLLGVQIQCAQCHDHKTEKWKQTGLPGASPPPSCARASCRSTGQAHGTRSSASRCVTSIAPAPRFAARDGGRPRPDHEGAARRRSTARTWAAATACAPRSRSG